MLILALVQELAKPADPTPWAWVVDHLQVVGWPSVILGCWYASRFLSKVEERAVLAADQIKAVVDSNAEVKTALEGQVQAQRELAQGVHQLAEAIYHQAEQHAEQLSLIRDMQVKQEVLAANQTTLMTNFQRVVEQLISIVKG